MFTSPNLTHTTLKETKYHSYTATCIFYFRALQFGWSLLLPKLTLKCGWWIQLCWGIGFLRKMITSSEVGLFLLKAHHSSWECIVLCLGLCCPFLPSYICSELHDWQQHICCHWALVRNQVVITLFWPHSTASNLLIGVPCHDIRYPGTTCWINPSSLELLLYFITTTRKNKPNQQNQLRQMASGYSLQKWKWNG